MSDDDQLMHGMSSINLEAKEHELRLLNEQLDQRRVQIVERAEKLLNKQKDIFSDQRCAATNNQEADSSSDVELSSDDASDVQFQSIAAPPQPQPKPSKSRSTASLTDMDEMPRTRIPQKMTRLPSSNCSNASTARSKESLPRAESKTPDADMASLGDLEMESEILGGTTIGKDAELRLQKARYRALEKNIQNFVDEAHEREKEIAAQKKLIKELQSKLKKEQKEKEVLNRKLATEKKESVDLVKKCKRLEHESYSMKSDLRDFKKEHRSKTDSMRNSHIRLNRALEDAEKYKNLLARYKNENKNSSELYNADMANLRKENRVLIKQKNELLSAFKKQLKLIDILKKQKIHLESAKVLQFTESQFIKTLDIGQSIK